MLKRQPFLRNYSITLGIYNSYIRYWLLGSYVSPRCESLCAAGTGKHCRAFSRTTKIADQISETKCMSGARITKSFGTISVSDFSLLLKGSGWDFKKAISASRTVSNLPFATPINSFLDGKKAASPSVVSNTDAIAYNICRHKNN